jgi:hypothetical protein
LLTTFSVATLKEQKTIANECWNACIVRKQNQKHVIILVEQPLKKLVKSVEEKTDAEEDE